MPFYINFTISFFTISIYLKKKVLLLSRPPFSALSSSSRARRRSEGDGGRKKKLINLSAFDFRVAPARSVIRARDHYQKKGSRRGKIRAKNTLDSSTHGDPRSFSISADLANQIEQKTLQKSFYRALKNDGLPRGAFNLGDSTHSRALR
jgi:hypothetical protein